MALILDDIYNEMKSAVTNYLRTKCEDPSEAIKMLQRYRKSGEPSVYNINDQDDLTYLVSHGLTAQNISRYFTDNTTFVSFIENNNTTTAEPIEAVRSRVLSKSGYILTEAIRNPLLHKELYEQCVGNILPHYIESLANSNK